MVRDTFDALHTLPVGAADIPPVAPAAPPREEKRRLGLFTKYVVRRTDGTDAPGQKHHGCEHFVLDLAHDPFALPAIRAYAEACADEYPALARDLRRRVTRMERAPFLATQREHHPENLRYPDGWLMVRLEEGGETFCYAGPSAEAVHAYHLALYTDPTMKDELTLADCTVIPPEEVLDVGGDTEPVDAVDEALGFRDVYEGEDFKGVRGTAAMWVAEAARRAKPGDVVPLFSAVY